ncbi:MAG: glycine cleavage system protein H [Desulfobacca sp.]|uniref:glycine cleavage system protein H n=1 Tax=Desulfobacca sp. TaxID=2067990 RepID=UPI004049486A
MNSVGTREERAAQMPNVAAAVKMVEVFGFKVPTSQYYLHRGHAWAVLEETGQVRVGMDDFSQKILGPAEAIEFPVVGREYYQDHVCLALIRQGHKAKVLAPVDGIVKEINAKVQERPTLVHDDPYGEGWLVRLQPTNLTHNLDSLYTGEIVADWIDQESHRLLGLMENTIGVTLPSGGSIVDDVYGHFPDLGWRRLVQEFFLRDLTKTWKKRS